MVTNVYAKSNYARLRINRALGFRKFENLLFIVGLQTYSSEKYDTLTLILTRYVLNLYSA